MEYSQIYNNQFSICNYFFFLSNTRDGLTFSDVEMLVGRDLLMREFKWGWKLLKLCKIEKFKSFAIKWDANMKSEIYLHYFVRCDKIPLLKILIFWAHFLKVQQQFLNNLDFSVLPLHIKYIFILIRTLPQFPQTIDRHAKYQSYKITIPCHFVELCENPDSPQRH